MQSFIGCGLVCEWNGMCDVWWVRDYSFLMEKCRSIKQRGLLGESFDNPSKRWWLGPWWAVEVIRYYWIQICLEDVVNKIFQTDWMWHVRERGFMITSRVFAWILEPCPDKTSYQNQSCSRQAQGQLSLFLRSRSGIGVPMSMPPPKAYNLRWGRQAMSQEETWWGWWQQWGRGNQAYTCSLKCCSYLYPPFMLPRDLSLANKEKCANTYETDSRSPRRG